jgi:hypothetical protein
VLGWLEIDGTRLIAEVNSKAWADAIRKKIETALGAGIRYRASEIQSPERSTLMPSALAVLRLMTSSNLFAPME